MFTEGDFGTDQVIDFQHDLAAEYRASFPENVFQFTFERPGFVI